MRTAALVLLPCGIALWIAIASSDVKAPPASKTTFVLAVLAIAFSVIPTTQQKLNQLFDAIQNPSPGKRAIAGICIAILAAAYLGWTAFRQGRETYPKFHDEHMHLVQMRMMAHGKLWMPQHPLADFFETFHVLVRPVYASIYFPGTALLYLPTIWLNLPIWLLPILAAGASVGLTYRVFTELVDGVAGALGAVLLLSLQNFRYLSFIIMSHSAFLFLAMALLWAWLRWRAAMKLKNEPGAKIHASHWMWLVGALAGWAAITRPLETVCFTAAIGLSIVLTLRAARASTGVWAKTIAMGLAGAAPFLALQLVMNVGITGRLLETPYSFYHKQFSPGLSFGFYDGQPLPPPATNLRQKQLFQEQFQEPVIEHHLASTVVQSWIEGKFPLIATLALPHLSLLMLLPCGVLWAWERKGKGVGVVMATLPLFVMLYIWFAFLLPSYTLPVTPAIILLVVCGARIVSEVMPRLAKLLSPMATLLVASAAIGALPEFNAEISDRLRTLPGVEASYIRLPREVQTPAIVLFHFDERFDSFHDEPVYNVEVARPDDASIIRAHDLGNERDRELYRYYAEHQPDRRIYRFERSTGVLTYLGTARELGAPK